MRIQKISQLKNSNNLKNTSHFYSVPTSSSFSNSSNKEFKIKINLQNPKNLIKKANVKNIEKS